jgi:hypothetical protein
MGSGRKRRLYALFPDKSIPLKWDDYEYALINIFGFEMDAKTSSSARTFTRGDETFTAYKPHRRIEKNVSKDDRDRAINALKRLGLLPED